MPFNPTLPVNASLISSSELRNQFNGLKDLIDTLTTQVNALQGQVDALSDTVNEGMADRPTFDETLAMIDSNAASNIDSIDALEQGFSDPPTSTELDAVVAKINDVIAGLKA